jgi:pimeloyl-ACP methyl ester carboxylesterase
VIDLRSFGLTELSSSAPSTAGWKEGEDLLALARYLKELGATSVGLIGISLGGSSVLNASHLEGADEVLDGGILAVSPPAVPEDVWARLSEPVPRNHPRYPLHRAFKAALISRVRSGRWPPEAEDMEHVMEHVSAPYYGVTADEIWRRAAGREHVPETKVPLLILHPEDDQIVKVDQARILEKAAAGNDLVRVWILPAGQHGLLETADRDWTHTVYRVFFERWARYAERPALSDGASAEVVYSAAETG